MDPSQAPVLDALADYHRKTGTASSRRATAKEPAPTNRVLAVLGREPFRDDVLATGAAGPP